MDKDDSVLGTRTGRSYAVPITTGWSGEQERRASQDYSSAHLLGNNRAPAPHISIPTTATPILMVPSESPRQATPPAAGISAPSTGVWDVAQLPTPSIDALHRMPSFDFPAVPLSAFEVNLVEEAQQDDVSDSELEDSESPRRRKGGQQRVKKKVGRPIAYKGDPNSPNLTDTERRRIKRRVANRESARRVRNRRQEQLEVAKSQMAELSATNKQLVSHAQAALAERDALAARLADLEAKFRATMLEKRNLQDEMTALKGSLKLSMEKLELDKQAQKEPPQDQQLPPRTSAFSSIASEPFTFKDEPWEGRGLDTSQQVEDMSMDVLNMLPSLNLSPFPSRIDDLDFGNELAKDSPSPAATQRPR